MKMIAHLFKGSNSWLFFGTSKLLESIIKTYELFISAVDRSVTESAKIEITGEWSGYDYMLFVSRMFTWLLDCLLGGW